jgi:hypothetical protein
MDRRQLYRDGLLATATCAALLVGSLSLGVDGSVFVTPFPAVAGCVGMVGVEVVLLRRPELTRRLWERRTVQGGSALVVLGSGGLAVSLGATWVVAVLVWGLLAYVALVGVVLVSGRNPLAWSDRY